MIEKLERRYIGPDTGCGGATFSDVIDKINEIIDALNEKKEQKPELVQQPPITYTYNSNASRDERLKAALLALLNSDLIKVKEGGYFTKQDLIEWVDRIPTDTPAEWSEEDEAIRIEVIKLLSNPSLYEACEHLREESVDWLKTLHTKVNVNSEKVSANSEKVNVNWSEEDEKMLKCCLIAINHYEKTCNIGDHRPTKFNIDGYLTSVDKVKSWLKSLRPSWKPSGEQMVMLRAVINDPNNAGAEGCQLALRELYEQLKRL